MLLLFRVARQINDRLRRRFLRVRRNIAVIEMIGDHRHPRGRETLQLQVLPLLIGEDNQPIDKLRLFEDMPVGAFQRAVRQLMMGVNNRAQRTRHALCGPRADEAFPRFIFIDDKMPAPFFRQPGFQHPRIKRLFLSKAFDFTARQGNFKMA